MFQRSDNFSAGDRQSWLGLLARAPQPMLESALDALPRQSHTWLRRPETGLVMVQGRIGGTGNRFNLGEMTVTRCALRLSGGICGVGYVQGRSHRRAELVATADAYMQIDAFRDYLDRVLISPVRGFVEQENRERRRKIQATKVDFFTVAREATESAGAA